MNNTQNPRAGVEALEILIGEGEPKAYARVRIPEHPSQALIWRRGYFDGLTRGFWVGFTVGVAVALIVGFLVVEVG